jgi:hypothetical protein
MDLFSTETLLGGGAEEEVAAYEAEEDVGGPGG